jgi:hypothetical protein
VRRNATKAEEYIRPVAAAVVAAADEARLRSAEAFLLLPLQPARGLVRGLLSIATVLADERSSAAYASVLRHSGGAAVAYRRGERRGRQRARAIDKQARSG